MPVNLKGRHLLTLLDYSSREIKFLIDTAIEMKKLKNAGVFPENLRHKNIASVFLKPSCRTRGAFAVAASDEGASLTNFTTEEIRFNIKESGQDIARVLGRMFDGIAFRANSHTTVMELARWAGVPVWNALCDRYHPTQILADMMTIKEALGDYRGLSIAYVGDGRNNVANSLLIGAIKLGMDFRIVAPSKLQPGKKFLETIVNGCRTKDPGLEASYMVTDDIASGVKGCRVIYNDVWASMGEEHLIAERIKTLKDYKITSQLMEKTGQPDAIYLHCLPALHNDDTEVARKHPDLQEVSQDVFENQGRYIFDQAENRLHTIKAVMVKTIC